MNGLLSAQSESDNDTDVDHDNDNVVDANHGNDNESPSQWMHHAALPCLILLGTRVADIDNPSNSASLDCMQTRSNILA